MNRIKGKSNNKKKEPVHILLNFKNLNIISNEVKTTLTEEDNKLGYKLEMSYPAFKPTNKTIKVNKNKQIYPAIFLLEDYYIDKDIIKQTTLGKNLNNKKLLDIFTKRKLLSQVQNEAYDKGLITDPKNDKERKDNLINNIKFILDLLFKQKNNFYFPFTPNKKQTRNYRNYKEFIENDKKSIILNRKIYSYQWIQKNIRNKSYDELFESADKINKLYITEYDTYYKNIKKDERLKQINLNLKLNLYSGNKINKNETRKLKCKDEKIQLIELLDEIDDEENVPHSLFYNLFKPLLQDEDERYNEEKRKRFEEKLIKNIDKKTDDFQLIDTVFQEKKDIIDDVTDIIKNLSEKVKELPEVIIDSKNRESIYINQLLDFQEEKLKQQLIECYKIYYNSINDIKSYEKNKEYYLSMPLDLLYSEYLELILNKKNKDYEDKFYIILKETLKKYEKTPSRHIKYSQKRIYDLLNIKKNYMNRYLIKN